MLKTETGRVLPPSKYIDSFSVQGAVHPEQLIEAANTLPDDDPRRQGSVKIVSWAQRRINDFMRSGGGFTSSGEPFAQDLSKFEKSPTFVDYIRAEGVVMISVADVCRELNIRSFRVSRGKEQHQLSDGIILSFYAEELRQRLFHTSLPGGGIDFTIHPYPLFSGKDRQKAGKLLRDLEQYVGNRIKRQQIPCAFGPRAIVRGALLPNSTYRPLSEYQEMLA